MYDFCPIVKGECNSNCVFKLGVAGTTVDDCSIFDAVQVIRSLKAPRSHIDNRIVNIIEKLNDIETNTSFDYTDSSQIKSELEEIKRLLKTKLN